MRKPYIFIFIFLLFVTSFWLIYDGQSLPKDNQKKASQSAEFESNNKENKLNKLGQKAVKTDGFLVTRVIDGDTIEIQGGVKVRYIGIDTPESVDPRKPVSCYAKEATSKNRQLVEGKKVFLERDVSETDKYGRLLRYVYVGNQFINKILVEEGFAYAVSYPPDVKYQGVLNLAQQEAAAGKKGLWGDCPAMNGEQADASCLIKGNISVLGEKIYHLPGQEYYGRTVIDESKGERWFCSEEAAKQAGWRRSNL